MQPRIEMIAVSHKPILRTGFRLLPIMIAFVAVIWVASFWCAFWCHFRLTSVSLWGGGLSVVHCTATADTIRLEQYYTARDADLARPGHRLGLRRVHRPPVVTWLPSVAAGVNYNQPGYHRLVTLTATELFLPLWIPLLACAIIYGVGRVRLTRIGYASHMCARCGYDVRACDDSRCSECGTAFQPSDMLAQTD